MTSYPVHGGFPMLGGGAGGQQDDTHARPSWLLIDDPASIWFAGMPPVCPAVINPDPPR